MRASLAAARAPGRRVMAPTGARVGAALTRTGTQLRAALFVVALLVFAGAWAQSVLPVPPLSGRVMDQTGTLTAQQVTALEAKLAAIETRHGSQVVVLMVPTARPEDIASFAQRVAATWQIGRKDVGDGLLLTVAKDDRDVNIQVARALQGAIPDVAAGRIIREQIIPAFRSGDYAGGLNSAVDRLAERIASEGLPQPAGERAAGRQRPSFGLGLQDLAIFLFVGVPIVGGLLSRVMGRKLGALATGGAVGALGWFVTASLLAAAGAALVALFMVGVMGVGGGGGFSSGGGGSFDGGGASGRW